MKKYTRFSAHASLAVVGLYMQQQGIWERVKQQVAIPQKVVKHTPQDKLLDALIHILAGGVGLNEINRRIRPDEGLQRAFGRASCAEQSTISETLNACGQEQVEQMRNVLGEILRQQSSCYRHNYEAGYLLLDVDLTGLLAGAQAEEASGGYFAARRNGRGRQLGRVWASDYDEIVVERLYSGKIQLEKNLGELVNAASLVLELTQAQRLRTIIRIDGGGGTDSQLNGLLEQDYQILAKVKNWQRTKRLAGSVKTWFADGKVRGRELGWVETPQPYVRPMRQLAVRWQEKDDWHYRILVTTLNDEALRQLLSRVGVNPDPLNSLQLIAQAYDARGGGVETSFKGSKSGLGLMRRNKRKFAAQEMLVLLAQLASNLTVWVRNHCPQLRNLGLMRMIRDAFQISGTLRIDEHGRVLKICLNQRHDLASHIVNAWRARFTVDDLCLYLGKI